MSEKLFKPGRHSIEGYAFNKNEKDILAERSKRYEEIKHHAKAVRTGQRSDYGRTHYSGLLPDDLDLSPEDIALICDDGNTCFGAVVECRHDRSYKVTIWTD